MRTSDTRQVRHRAEAAIHDHTCALVRKDDHDDRSSSHSETVFAVIEVTEQIMMPAPTRPTFEFSTAIADRSTVGSTRGGGITVLRRVKLLGRSASALKAMNQRIIC